MVQFLVRNFSKNSENTRLHPHILYDKKVWRHLFFCYIGCGLSSITFSLKRWDVKQSSFLKAKIDVNFMHEKMLFLSYLFEKLFWSDIGSVLWHVDLITTKIKLYWVKYFIRIILLIVMLHVKEVKTIKLGICSFHIFWRCTTSSSCQSNQSNTSVFLSSSIHESDVLVMAWERTTLIKCIVCQVLPVM